MRLVDSSGFVFGEIDSLPGCSQIAVSHAVFCAPEARNSSFGKQAHKERLQLLKKLGYEDKIDEIKKRRDYQQEWREYLNSFRVDEDRVEAEYEKSNQIVKKYTELAELFPDVKDKIVQIYPSGDKHIIVEFISSGTAPDGLKFELPICTIFTIEKGFITKDFTYYDNF